MKAWLVRQLDPLYRWLTAYMGRSGLILFGKSDPPPAPDYTAAANAQSAASKDIATQQTFANRPDQNTPWGSSFWTTGQTTDPATGQPVTTWTQNQSLDPALQSALNDQLGIQSGKSQLAGSFMNRVAQDYSQPFNWDALPGMANTPDAQFTYARDAQSYIPSYSLDASRIQPRTSGYEYEDPTGQDYSKINPTTQASNEVGFGSQRQQIEDASLQRLQPQHDRELAQLQTQLANQGILQGTQAYNMELQNLNDRQSRERFDAMNYAGNEQQRMNQQLLANQGQAFGQGITSQQAMNAALNNLMQQRMQAGQFRLQAGQQGFQQAGQSQQQQNQTLAAQQAMQANQAKFYNDAQQQQFSQNQASNAQNWQQMMQQAQYQNQLRQQALSEEAMSRGMSLNELNALLSGSQVNNPQMPQFMSASSGQAPQLLQAAQSQYGASADAFNAQQGGMQGLMSGLFGLGASSAPYWAPLLFA